MKRNKKSGDSFLGESLIRYDALTHKPIQVVGVVRWRPELSGLVLTCYTAHALKRLAVTSALIGSITDQPG